jgi:hypothetical protein
LRTSTSTSTFARAPDAWLRAGCRRREERGVAVARELERVLDVEVVVDRRTSDRQPHQRALEAAVDRLHQARVRQLRLAARLDEVDAIGAPRDADHEAHRALHLGVVDERLRVAAVQRVALRVDGGAELELRVVDADAADEQ